MPVTYSIAARNAGMTAKRDLCQNGTLQLMTAANAVISTHTLSATGGSVAAGAWTLGFVAATVAATGTANGANPVTQARIRNSGGTDVITGLTVATSGADLNIQNTSINTGQDVTISGTITEN